MSKTKFYKRHFKQRVKQRYGIDINQKDLKNIVNMIQTGKCEFIEKQSNRVSMFKLKYKGKSMRVVYDRNRGVPITALTGKDM